MSSAATLKREWLCMSSAATLKREWLCISSAATLKRQSERGILVQMAATWNKTVIKPKVKTSRATNNCKIIISTHIPPR